MFFCLPPGISPSAVRPSQKCPKNPAFRDFPPVGVWSAKTENFNKLRNFGEKNLGRPDFFLKVPLALGNCIFAFSAQPWDFF